MSTEVDVDVRTLEVKAEAGPSRAVEGRAFYDGTAPITAHSVSLRRQLGPTQIVEQARRKHAH